MATSFAGIKSASAANISSAGKMREKKIGESI